MDWTRYTYWIEGNGPLAVISEQQKLVAYVANEPAVLVDVPEPSGFAMVVLTFCFMLLISAILDIFGGRKK
jgi:hypothetical protein